MRASAAALDELGVEAGAGWSVVGADPSQVAQSDGLMVRKGIYVGVNDNVQARIWFMDFGFNFFYFIR